ELSREIAGMHTGVRIGRQELTLGTSRIVSLRDSPNIRRAFDGVHAFQDRGAVRLDAFWLRPITIETGVFDDRSHTDGQLWGAQLSAPHAPWVSGQLELYYLDYQRDDAHFAAASAQEHRRSLGLRWFGTRAALDWNLEALGQTGDFAGGSIRAW